MSSSSKNVKRQQWILGGVVLAVLGSLLGSFLYFYGGRPPKPQYQQAPVKKVDLPGDNLGVQEMWMSRVDSELGVIKERSKLLEEALLLSQQEESRKHEENIALKKELQGMKAVLKEVEKASLSKEEELSFTSNPHRLDTEKGSPFSNDYDDSFQPKDARINSFSPRALQVTVVNDSKREKVQHVDQAIPAGTTVKALLVSSLDAPCGVFSSNDPHPVKLRVLDDSKLPKRVRVKLKGSLLIGSAFGNISSERIQVRLERLTQNKADGTFVETQVTGYVTGEDGKYGIRGVVVDRSDKLVKSAAYTGFFSGVSQFFSSSLAAQNINQATQGLPNSAKWDMLKQSGGMGMSSAFEKLSEYFIKRAEQIQPVIQVAAGRIVDITFSHGCEIGDLHSRKQVEKTREDSRRKDV